MAEFYTRAATSALYVVAGGMKATGAMNKQMSAFGYPFFFAQLLGVGELALAAANVGAELAPLAGLAPPPFANVWVQRASALLLGGAVGHHVVAADGGLALPLAMLLMSAAVPALRGDSTPLEAAGVAAALAGLGFGISQLIERKPDASKSK